MKKLFVGTAVVLVLLATGCSSDDTPLTPGDPESPAYQAFQSGFGSFQEANFDMTNISFEMIGSILEGGTAPSGAGFEAITYTLDYNEETSFWVAHLVFDDEAGSIVTASDSVQFVVSGTPVQYPDPNELDLVRSFLTVEAEGVEGSLSGYQNMTAAPVANETGVLVTLDGEGGLEGSFTGSDTDSSGVTTCAVEAHLTTTLSNVAIQTGESAPSCPLSGRATYQGRLTVECTGAHALSHSAVWVVNVDFVDGTSMNVSAVSGGNVWNFSTSCE
jgi:hypothetical protein